MTRTVGFDMVVVVVLVKLQTGESDGYMCLHVSHADKNFDCGDGWDDLPKLDTIERQKCFLLGNP